MLGNAPPGGTGTTRVNVPFYLRGTLDDPKFSRAGTPGLIRDQSPSNSRSGNPSSLNSPSRRTCSNAFPEC
jgi:hypothetical protein